MQDKVFISFSSSDRTLAVEVCNTLESRGFHCWISSRDVRGGENYQEAIVRAIREVKVMVLVFTANANASNEIKKELALASRSNTIVIPLRLEEVTPSEALDYELATRQWIDFFEDREQALQTLSDRIGGIIRREPKPAEDAAGAAASRPEPKEAEPKPDTGAPIGFARNPPKKERSNDAVAEPERTGIKGGVKLSVPAVAGLGAMGVLALAAVIMLFENRPSAELRIGELANAIEAAAPPAQVSRDAPELSSPAPQQRAETQNPAPGSGTPAPLAASDAYAKGDEAYNRKDYAEAARWYTEAANQGHAGAESSLGYLYDQGLGVAQSDAQAVSWYRKAAEQGEADAQNNLGAMYQAGQGVAQDYAEAVSWYRKAADKGHTNAQYNLALLYAAGEGVPKDLSAARSLMQKAADAGDADAKKWLAEH